ncbi:predicted protein [Nematostella vectensis]|uniref:Uncharacterized protein n=1 Tax=Nematostella vectensis TaxID=45351 RepID=A7SI96_NEMVE|nr:rho-related protein racF1 [Nematostella vectensis]EDO36554.1 predicted protein [Nematostella vectensis]|eukprot:XP_001628617.1 predicted protein [Nematostella vectensis]
MEDYVTLKLYIVGDGAVGKTALFITAATNTFPTEYIPTAYDASEQDFFNVDGIKYQAVLFDSAGGEDFDRLRPLGYPNTDIFLVCFDIAHRASFENVALRWLPELDHFSPGVPRVLVGNKKDLRPKQDQEDSHSIDFVSYEEGKEAAQNFKMQYIENSALLNENVKEVITTSIRIARDNLPKKGKRKCHVM